MPSKDKDIVDPPANAEILFGFKTTGECVPYYYEFGVWYERAVHVIPRDIETIKRYPESYEMHELYPCEYVFDHMVPYCAFQITKFVRVFNEPTRVSLVYNRRGQTVPIIKIGEEEFS